MGIATILIWNGTELNCGDKTKIKTTSTLNKVIHGDIAKVSIFREFQRTPPHRVSNHPPTLELFRAFIASALPCEMQKGNNQ